MLIMEDIYRHCCGIDVHKNLIVTCLKKSSRQELREFDTMTGEIKMLANWLTEVSCEMAATESTGPYRKPQHNLFQLLGLDTMTVNASHTKTASGRNTDSKVA